MKELAQELGYATDMKDYKENSNKYKGSIADVSNIIRVVITTKNTTPNLYNIMKILGREELYKRLVIFNK